MLIFTDVDLFNDLYKIPSLPQYTIGINLPYEQVVMMRNLSPGIESIDYTKRYIIPFWDKISFIILDKENKPSYSNFNLIFDNEKPIFISQKMLKHLNYMVNNFNDEISGIINHKGIENLTLGNKDESLQPILYTKGITFHTHPFFFYKKFNTNVGWPSKLDVETEKNKHLIMSKEGIYLLSKPTCNPPSKKNLHIKNSSQIKNILNKCSWILLPWNKEIYIFP